MSRVAVVVPVHDDGALALEAVASIQEHEPIEIVVVDDGSTDPATLAAMDELRARGIPVLTGRRGGPGAARSAGVAATTAPFILPLDADDLLEPGAAATLADALERAPEAGFAWGDYLLFGDHEGRYRAPSAFLPWSLTWVNVYPVTSMIRRSAFERAGGWSDHGYEDWSLWLRFVELGITGVPSGEVVYRRRLHGDGRQLSGDRRRHRELYRELRERHPDAFGRRAELRRRERPSPLKRLAYPLLFGARAVLPVAVEALLQRTMMRLGLRLSR